MDKSNTPISFKKIKSATSSDESILKVKGLSYRANLSGVVRVDTLKEGTVTLSLVSIDNDDCEVRAKFTVKVVNNLNEINVDDEGDNCVYDASVLSLEDNTDGTSIGLSVNDMLGASFEIKQPVKGVWINDSNLIVDANSIFKPTFVTIQSEGCIDLTIVITPISFK